MDKIFKLVILLILSSCSLNPNSTLWTKNKKIEYENSLNIIEIDPKKKVLTKEINSKTLTSVLNDSKFKGKKIDFLDIDVEGADIDVLESLDFHKYSPELICVEVIEKNNEDSQIFKFLKKRGYQKIWSGVFSHVFKRT